MVERILERIGANKWSISEFERRMDVSNGTFNGWRNRDSVPPKKLAKVAEILGTTEAYLRGETDDPRIPGSEIDPDDIQYALLSETQELTEDEMQEVIEYVRFKKSQKRKAVSFDVAAYGGSGVEHKTVTQEQHQRGQGIAKKILEERKKKQ